MPEEHAPSTVPALVTISLTHEPEPLGEYVVVTDATSLDAFVAEVRSHGHIYAAEWRSLSDVTGDKSTMEREAVSFEDIRSQLYWLFDD